MLTGLSLFGVDCTVFTKLLEILKIEFLKWLIKPGVCILSSCILSKLFYIRYLIQVKQIVAVPFSICAMSFFYILFLFLTDCFKISQLKDLIKSAIK